MNPKVSIIIPTYNRADLICETLDSVFSQTYKDFEVIVIDDGSTDNTSEVISSYDSNIHYIKQVNKGEGGARNTGIRFAKGEYIAFLDSDDLWMPEKLKRQMDLFESEPNLGLVYCDSIVFDHDTGKDLRHYSQEYPIAQNLLCRCFISSPTPVVRKKVFYETGFFDENLCLGVDWDMWLRIFAQYPIEYLDESLALYRWHRTSMIRELDIYVAYNNLFSVIEKAIKLFPEFYKPYQKEALSNLYFYQAKAFLSNNKPKEARKCFLSAINCHNNVLRSIFFITVTFCGNKFLKRLVCIYRAIKNCFLKVNFFNTY